MKIVAAELTPDDVGNVSEIPDLLDQIDADVASLTAERPSERWGSGGAVKRASCPALSYSVCVDGPLGSRAKTRILTLGPIAIMCPASHEGVPCQATSSQNSPSNLV